MLLGALLGPMNGSVGASVLGLSRVVAPRLDAEGVPPATRDAVIAVASTLGVLVPPSLVLILLSDAMLYAHTYAVTQTGRIDRVINTQDIFHAALAPAGIFLVLCVALAWCAGRDHAVPPARERLRTQQGLFCRHLRWSRCWCCWAASPPDISSPSRPPPSAPSCCLRGLDHRTAAWRRCCASCCMTPSPSPARYFRC